MSLASLSACFFCSTCCGDLIQYLWLPHHLPLCLPALHTIGFNVAMVHVDIPARQPLLFHVDTVETQTGMQTNVLFTGPALLGI